MLENGLMHVNFFTQAVLLIIKAFTNSYFFLDLYIGILI